VPKSVSGVGCFSMGAFEVDRMFGAVGSYGPWP
jgi:hypothetical protein